jgi:hypothetical protein
LAAAEIRNTINGFVIPREQFVRRATEALAECRFVQISGLPGTGKSAVLQTMVNKSLDAGTALFLKSDRLASATWAQYAMNTGIGGTNLEELHVEAMGVGLSTVFIDGLDRVEVRHRGVVLDVVNTMLDSALLSGLRMLVTARDTRSEVELAAAWWSSGGYGAEAARAGRRRSALVELARSFTTWRICRYCHFFCRIHLVTIIAYRPIMARVPFAEIRIENAKRNFSEKEF